MSLIARFNNQHHSVYKSSWLRFLVLGIALLALGIVTISLSTFTTLVSVVFLGFVLFTSGVLIVFDTVTFWWKRWSGFFLHVLFAILYLAIGIMLITNPVQGAMSLTFMLGLFYIIIGVFRVGFYSAFQGPKWGWGWLNGMITLLIGILIFTNWPVSGLFVIGLFVGIDLLFAGWFYITSALAARYLSKNG